MQSPYSRKDQLSFAPEILLIKLAIVLTKSAPASILSYLLHEEERKIFAKIYLM